MRKVSYKYFNSVQQKWVNGVGVFHRWGIQTIRDRDDIESNTVAIIENPDGTVIEAMPNNIQFLTGKPEDIID